MVPGRDPEITLPRGQEVQRLKSATGDEIWTLIANIGTRITGKIRDPKDTLEILQLMAGTEYRPEMPAMVQQVGLMGSHWRDDNRVILREQKKVDVEEVQVLQEGENVTLFNGILLRCSAFYIKDADKFASEAVCINRSSPRPRGYCPLIVITYSNIELVIPFHHFRG
ncbi:hypothetical protein [Serratia symbiotica]|uniref:hypothetical protein n=1 Tax=Serratia symbiotica TaxID=138074 RepID=UPI0030CBE006